MSEEHLLNHTVDLASLTNRQRGNLAELAFMRKAASLGFSVAKPWGEGERYDVIVAVGNMCWRVQVKSVLAKHSARNAYRVKTSGGDSRQGHTPYSATEIDFLAAYIFPEDLWYIFPAKLIANRKGGIWLTPRSKRSIFHQYREAWKLMKLAPHDVTANAVGATAGT
jgi:PD-(D/E)XK endonuclease